MRRIFAVPGRIVGAIAGVVGDLVRPLRPDPGTTEAALYFGLMLLAAGLVVKGEPWLALLVPGAVITILASAPVIVGVLRKGA